MRRGDFALQRSSKGIKRKLEAASGLDVVVVISVTRSRVCAWFSFSLTAGAPETSNVPRRLLPPFIK